MSVHVLRILSQVRVVRILILPWLILEVILPNAILAVLKNEEHVPAGAVFEELGIGDPIHLHNELHLLVLIVTRKNWIPS